MEFKEQVTEEELDKIADLNIEVIQDLLPDAVGANSTVGVWNNYLRAKLYRFSTSQQDSKKLDLNGFLDKDTEKLLMKQVFTGYSW